MNFSILYPGLMALWLFGGSVGVEPPAGPARPIIRWPGGWMYLDKPGVINHDGAAPKMGSTTVITGSANGVGNSIVVDNGKSSGKTILRNVRNGIGNSITVTPKGPVFEVKPEKMPSTPAEKK